MVLSSLRTKKILWRLTSKQMAAKSMEGELLSTMKEVYFYLFQEDHLFDGGPADLEEVSEIVGSPKTSFASMKNNKGYEEQ